ncbi:MAG: hypothetical protein HeimC3_06800 [Candidatus Heimdallarchaeota archaeon LC_3]|nr:MAG: hypothetical protein HeimC3_06800 [Candidatus Heimdallarchaeota archaeon LC_3]
MIVNYKRYAINKLSTRLIEISTIFITKFQLNYKNKNMIRKMKKNAHSHCYNCELFVIFTWGLTN